MEEESLESISYEQLSSPIYIGWQLTNRCNLECIHCLWESGPNAAYPDELNVDEVLKFGKELVDHQVLYVTLSGGEPLLHPGFWKLADLLSSGGVEVKIETNGQLISKSVAKRIADLNPRSVQVSIDGASQETYSKMRPNASLHKALDALRYLNEYGVRTEVLYVPSKFSLNEVGKLIDMVADLGVKAFYTGKVYYMGRAVKYWNLLGLNEKEYEYLKNVIDEKAKQYEGKMRLYFHPRDIVEELQIKFKQPTGNPIITANGKVKLINSVPYVVADIRKHSFEEMWERYKKGWKHPKVAEYVKEVSLNPRAISKAELQIELPDL